MPDSVAPAPTIPLRRWLLWWGLSAAWWVVQGMTAAITYRHSAGVPWDHALRVNLVSATVWIPLTVFALWLAARHTVDRHSWPRTLPLVLAAAAGVVLARAALVLSLNDVVGWYPQLPGWPQVLLTSVANNLFTFALLVGVGHASVYARRVSEREQALAHAELQHLKAQLHPHFLFNALNAISATVRHDPELATRMISQLSVVLRHALQRVNAQEVSLEEELTLLTAYVEIEQIRFEDRLRVEWSIAPDSRQAMVPHLLLQPLVENAIKHGIAPRSEPGTVRIDVRRRADELHLSVRDDGVGLRADAEHASREGIGLANVRRRLHQLYGAAQRLTVRAVEPRGLVVDVALPYREARSA